MRATFGRPPVRFVENRGQFGPRFAFVAQGRGRVVALGESGVRFGFDEAEERSAVDVEFAGARPGAAPSGEEAGNDVAVDAAGSAYVVGRTRFDAAYFPSARGPDSSHNGGMNDAFVAKLTPSGDDLVYCGFVGGAGEDSAIALALDAEGCVYLTGRTTSTEATFPLAAGIDATANGMTDALVVKVSPDGRDLVWSGFLGAADFERPTRSPSTPRGTSVSRAPRVRARRASP